MQLIHRIIVFNSSIGNGNDYVDEPINFTVNAQEACLVADDKNYVQEQPDNGAMYNLSVEYDIDGKSVKHEYLERQEEKIDPLFKWVESEFGFKPVLHSSFFGGKQDDGLVDAIKSLLKSTNDCELAAIDALASAAHSLIIAIGIFRGRLQIKEAIELIRLEEDVQVDMWGLIEGGHDLDVADLMVQIASAVVFLGLLRRF